MELIHTYRNTDPDRSVALYEALGFEERRRLPIRDEAVNIFLGVPGCSQPELSQGHARAPRRCAVSTPAAARSTGPWFDHRKMRSGKHSRHMQRLRRDSAPGRNRTCDLALRRRALYPLSYGRGDGRSVAGGPRGATRPRNLRELGVAGVVRVVHVVVDRIETRIARAAVLALRATARRDELARPVVHPVARRATPALERVIQPEPVHELVRRGLPRLKFSIVPPGIESKSITSPSQVGCSFCIRQPRAEDVEVDGDRGPP
jgi:hypothetical protein